MTAATIATYILVIYGVSITIALACALERIGYWKQEAKDAPMLRQWVARLEQDVQSRQEAVNEWRMAANVLMEDNKALEAGNRYLRARGRLVRTAWWRRRQKRSLYPAWVVLARLP